MGCIYFKGKVLNKIPEKKVIFNATNFSESILHLIGYVKIKDFGIDVILLEKIINNIYDKKRHIFYFDYNILNKYNIPQFVLAEILVYLGFVKIAGTLNVSYWKKKKKSIIKKKYYDKNSPFYVLKKLQ